MANVASVAKRVLVYLSSLRLTIAVLLLLLCGVAISAIIPQRDPTSAEIIRHGAFRFRILWFIGAFDIFHSAWFVTVLIAFILNSVACLVSGFSLSLRRIGWVLVHVSIPITMIGVGISVELGKNGFMEFIEGETESVVRGESGDSFVVPFNIHLKAFKIEYAEPLDYLLVFNHATRREYPMRALPGRSVSIEDEQAISASVIRKIEHVRITVQPENNGGESSYEPTDDQSQPPALLVEVRRGETTERVWLILEQFHNLGAGYLMVYLQEPFESQYKSTIIIQDGDTTLERTIWVNHDMRYRGYSIQQSGTTQNGTVLRVIYDPGVPVIFLGFVIGSIGMICMVWRKRKALSTMFKGV